MKQLAHVFTGLLAVSAIALLTSGCQIIAVEQPPTVAAGDTVAVGIFMQDPNVPAGPNETDRFVLCARVPVDWTYLEGAYVAVDHDTTTTIIAAGTGRESQRWADSASIYFPPPAGMKWIGLLADSAHTYADTILIDAALTFKAGTTTGTFDIWYLMTKNAGGLMDPGGMSQGWADTSNGNFITITAGPTAVLERDLVVVPKEYALGQNYPNPFNPSTTIPLFIPPGARGPVRLDHPGDQCHGHIDCNYQ